MQHSIMWLKHWGITWFYLLMPTPGSNSLKTLITSRMNPQKNKNSKEDPPEFIWRFGQAELGLVWTTRWIFFDISTGFDKGLCKMCKNIFCCVFLDGFCFENGFEKIEFSMIVSTQCWHSLCFFCPVPACRQGWRNLQGAHLFRTSLQRNTPKQHDIQHCFCNSQRVQSVTVIPIRHRLLLFIFILTACPSDVTSDQELTLFRPRFLRPVLWPIFNLKKTNKKKVRKTDLQADPQTTKKESATLPTIEFFFTKRESEWERKATSYKRH